MLQSSQVHVSNTCTNTCTYTCMYHVPIHACTMYLYMQAGDVISLKCNCGPRAVASHFKVSRMSVISYKPGSESQLPPQEHVQNCNHSKRISIFTVKFPAPDNHHVNTQYYGFLQYMPKIDRRSANALWGSLHGGACRDGRSANALWGSLHGGACTSSRTTKTYNKHDSLVWTHSQSI